MWNFSVSHTTRPNRDVEKDGRDYYFLEQAQFLAMVENNEFIEWAQVHGNYYGTTRQEIREKSNGEKILLLDIDVQGGLAIRETEPEAVLIFLLPPSLETLRERLETRGTDDADVVSERLTNATEELKAADRYDFQVWNRDLNKAVEEVAAIIAMCDRENNR